MKLLKKYFFYIIILTTVSCKNSNTNASFQNKEPWNDIAYKEKNIKRLIKERNADSLFSLGYEIIYNDFPSSYYNKGVFLLKEAVKLNNVNAMACLGEIFVYDEDQKNYGLELLEEAAKNNSTYAFNVLSNYYFLENPKKAISYLEKGLSSDDYVLHYNLAYIYIYGRRYGSLEENLKKYINVSKGMEILKNAASNGGLDAQEELGLLYLRGGNAVPKNDSLAKYYLKKVLEDDNYDSYDVIESLKANRGESWKKWLNN